MQLVCLMCHFVLFSLCLELQQPALRSAQSQAKTISGQNDMQARSGSAQGKDCTKEAPCCQD